MDDSAVKEALSKRSTEVRLPCQLGLHLRMASRFIFFARQFKSNIIISNQRLAVDGKSIFGLACLGATWNSKLKIEVEGEDADQAIVKITEYFHNTDNCVDMVV